MKNTFSTLVLLGLLIGIFLSAMVLNNRYLKDISVDLTENQIYSLSQGSQRIASELTQDINLYLFFSQDNSKGMTALRDYKIRVEALLREYVRLADGKITLEVIDTEAFSEEEDQAASFGLTPASAGVGGSTVYFGLAGTNALDDTMIISFFDPSKETFLEYDISSLLHKLSSPEPIKLTIVSDLEIAGGQNPLTGEVSAPYALYQQFQEIFDVSLLSSSDEALPDETQVLMLWHPQNINEALLRQIDQFIMQGGKALVLMDAHYESDPMAQMGSVGSNSSVLPLLATYGVSFNSAEVVLDALTGLEVRDAEGGIVRHMGFLGLGKEQINNDDIASADLDSINGASFASLSLASNSQLTQTALLSSSATADLIETQKYMATRDPEILAADFFSVDKPFTLAARYSGPASSHFSESSENSALVQNTDNLNIVVIGDADIAANRFWVQQSSFFGQTVFDQFANNGDFILNILENLSGNENLIGIRGRGTFTRPFTKVQAIQVVAEEKFREQEKRLKAQLDETEALLVQLQSQLDSESATQEQEAAIAAFTKQRGEIRKSLREVQFQLQRDIDELGNILKLVNIVLMPLLIVLILFLLAKLFKKKASQSFFIDYQHTKEQELLQQSTSTPAPKPRLRVNPKVLNKISDAKQNVDVSDTKETLDSVQETLKSLEPEGISDKSDASEKTKGKNKDAGKAKPESSKKDDVEHVIRIEDLGIGTKDSDTDNSESETPSTEKDKKK